MRRVHHLISQVTSFVLGMARVLSSISHEQYVHTIQVLGIIGRFLNDYTEAIGLSAPISPDESEEANIVLVQLSSYVVGAADNVFHVRWRSVR